MAPPLTFTSFVCVSFVSVLQLFELVVQMLGVKEEALAVLIAPYQ
jgi:hypothetical protein